MTTLATPVGRFGRVLGRRQPGGAAPVARVAEAAGNGVLEFARDPFRVLLVALTIVNVSRIHQQVGALRPLRPALLLVVAAAGYAFLYPKALARVNPLRFWPMQRVALLGVLACFSVAFGIGLGRSALFILDSFSKTILYCFLLALAIRGVRDLYTFAWAYVISCGILSYLSLFVFKLSVARGGGIARLSDLNTYDANDVCVVLLIGLALVMLLLQVARGPKRLVLMLIMLGIGGAIARSGSRGGFLGLVVFGVAALFMINTVSGSKKLLGVGAVLMGLALFAPPGYWEQMRTILNSEDDYNLTSLDGRKALALRGLGYMSRYPVFGVGINNFGRAECTISGLKVGRAYGGIRCGAPHNSYVQAGSELGVPGLIVWSSLIFGGMLAMLKLRGKLPRQWRRGNDTERFLYNSTHYFALALAGFAASSFFVSFAWMDLLYILAAMMTGLYVSIKVYVEQRAPADGASAPEPPARGPGWRVLASARRVTDARNLLPARPA